MQRSALRASQRGDRGFAEIIDLAGAEDIGVAGKNLFDQRRARTRHAEDETLERATARRRPGWPASVRRRTPPAIDAILESGAEAGFLFIEGLLALSNALASMQAPESDRS